MNKALRKKDLQELQMVHASNESSLLSKFISMMSAMLKTFKIIQRKRLHGHLSFLGRISKLQIDLWN